MRGDTLGFFLERRWRVVEQRRLAVANLVDALAQQGPLFARDLEVAAEVEQGVLSNFGPDPLAVDQAVGVVGLAVGTAGLRASDEHGETVAAGAPEVNTRMKYYGTTFTILDSQLP